jgi:myo-inositol-1(or 4)-monophosphatase
MFWAEKGAGCWLNDTRRMRVSGRRVMNEALFATGVPFGAKSTLPAFVQDLARLMPQCAGVRRMGVSRPRPRLCGGRSVRGLLGA